MKAKAGSKRFDYYIFLGVRWLVKLFYPRITVEGTANLTDEPTVIVGNHTQMNGPICAEFYMPCESVTWCASEMMTLKEVPEYAYRDFWCHKPRLLRFFYKLLSYIIAPLSVLIFNNAKTIPVYRDERTITTFRKTLAALKSGKSIVIFPEHAKEYNHIICDFQRHFVDIARLYFRSADKALTFTPLYIAPRLKKIVLGKPTSFNPDAPLEEEKNRICEYLMEEITKIATELPPHIVVPYENISRKEYKLNR